MPVRGNGKAALDRLIAELRSAASGELYTKAKRATAAEALTQIALGFRESRNPYGEPWKPPKLRSGKPLLDTARLRNSFSADITGTGVRVGSNVKYSRLLHYGGKVVPKRAKALRFPVPIYGPVPRGVRGGRGLGHMFVFVRSVTLPARYMVPIKARGLGPIWTRALAAAASLVLRRHFGR